MSNVRTFFKWTVINAAFREIFSEPRFNRLGFANFFVRMNLSTPQSLRLRLLLVRENWQAFTPKLQTALEMKQKVQRTGGNKHLKGKNYYKLVFGLVSKLIGRFPCRTLFKGPGSLSECLRVFVQRDQASEKHMRSIWSDHNLISGNVIERVIPNGSWERQVYMFPRIFTFYRSSSPAASWIKHSRVSWRSFKTL